MAMTETLPSREAMLDYLRYVTSEWRLRHYAAGELGDGKPATSGALFQLLGKRYEAFAEGDGARDEIVARTYRLVRSVLGQPIREATDRRVLEHKIIEAAWRGDTAAVDALTRELVTKNERPTPPETRFVPLRDHGRFTKAPFGRRQAW
jgi:hypothetical protein